MSDDILRYANAMMLPRVVYTSATQDKGQFQEPAVLSVTTSAQKFDLNTTAVFANATQPGNQISGTKGCFISLQARGGDVSVQAMHTSDSTSATVTSAATSPGLTVYNGQPPVSFWVEGPYSVLGAIGTASCSLLVWKSQQRPVL